MSNPSLSGARQNPGQRTLVRNLAPRTRDPANAEFLRALLVLGGALFVLTIATYLATTNWTGAFPRDKATLVLGRDFLNLVDVWPRAVRGRRAFALLRHRDLQ